MKNTAELVWRVLAHVETRLAEAQKHDRRWGVTPKDKKIFLSDEGWELVLKLLRDASPPASGAAEPVAEVLVREGGWSATPLGPIEEWPPHGAKLYAAPSAPQAPEDERYQWAAKVATLHQAIERALEYDLRPVMRRADIRKLLLAVGRPTEEVDADKAPQAEAGDVVRCHRWHEQGRYCDWGNDCNAPICAAPAAEKPTGKAALDELARIDQELAAEKPGDAIKKLLSLSCRIALIAGNNNPDTHRGWSDEIVAIVAALSGDSQDAARGRK